MTATEMTRLPQFCWGEYNPALTQPQFRIDGCGTGMNHYCPALVLHNRALKSTSGGTKKQFLQRALTGVEYTLQWMKVNMEKYPNCPIRAHVEASYMMIRRDLGLPPVLTQTNPMPGSRPPAAQATANPPVASTPAETSGADGAVNSPKMIYILGD